MELEELKEKIKDKETIFYIKNINDRNICKETLSSTFYIASINGDNKNFLIKHHKSLDDTICDIDHVFNSRYEASNFINNNFIYRVEKFPYISWKDMKNGKNISFTDKNGVKYYFQKFNELGNTIIKVYSDENNVKKFEYNEKGFYQAYNFCKNKFLG